jgi:hypothetical protein
MSNITKWGCIKMKEQWVEIKGYRGLYEVSNFGNVRSKTRVVEMKNGCFKTVKGKMLTPKTNMDI